MTIVFVSKHQVKPGDTADSLVRDFHLSSWKAVTDIPANRSCRSTLLDGGKLPTGSIISIPPNAFQLAKDRQYALHRVAPLLRSHFDELQALADSALAEAFGGSSGETTDARGVLELQKLAALTMSGIDAIARVAAPLVTVCIGMAETHVAEDYDRKAAGTVADPLCGLYWAITPPKLNLWRDVWDIATHCGKWSGQDAAQARQASMQYLTTIRSLIVQQLDLRVRQCLALERRLLAERSGG